jgi:hypothetical protein
MITPVEIYIYPHALGASHFEAAKSQLVQTTLSTEEHDLYGKNISATAQHTPEQPEEWQARQTSVYRGSSRTQKVS